MSSCYDKRTSIGMSLQPSSPAFPFMENLQNRSGFLKVVLEDFLKANAKKDLDGYAELSENERLEKYFGVGKPNNMLEQELLNAIGQMRAKEKQRLGYEVEYIRLFQEYEDIFEKYEPMEQLFRVLSCYFAKRIVAGNGLKKNIRHAFFSDFFEFQKTRMTSSSTGELIAKYKCDFSAAEKVFILLADQWFSVSAMMEEAKKYTAEQVVDCVLGYMESHPECSHMDGGAVMSLFSRFIRDRFNTAADLVPVA